MPSCHWLVPVIVLIPTVSQLLRRYDFAVVNPVKPMKLFDAAFWVANDFYVRVTKKATMKKAGKLG